MIRQINGTCIVISINSAFYLSIFVEYLRLQLRINETTNTHKCTINFVEYEAWRWSIVTIIFVAVAIVAHAKRAEGLKIQKCH